MVLIKEFYTEYEDYNDDTDYQIWDKFHYHKNPLYVAIKHGEIDWTKKTAINTEIDTYSRKIDWFLCYFVLILSLLESLFNCYRYLTTWHTSQHMNSASPTYVLKYFGIYALFFIFIFIINVQLYYWIFPLIVISHCCFNLYCTWKYVISCCFHSRISFYL